MARAPRCKARELPRRDKSRLQSNDLPVAQFPALQRAGFTHAFVGRVSGVDVSYDKAEVLSRLDHVHHAVRASLGLEHSAFLTAQQVHGDRIAVIDSPVQSEQCFAECDGLITNQRGVSLGIYVADCCAVYLLDPVRH